MTLEIRLVKDDVVLLSLPVDPVGGVNGSLSDDELDRLSRLYSLGSSRKRLRVMLEFAKGREMRFSDVMQLVTNPKIAQDCLQPLLNDGLVLHGGRGSTYRTSRRGAAIAVAMTLVVGRMLDALGRESGDSH
jgi:predicted transcriptional regulator